MACSLVSCLGYFTFQCCWMGNPSKTQVKMWSWNKRAAAATSVIKVMLFLLNKFQIEREKFEVIFFSRSCRFDRRKMKWMNFVSKKQQKRDSISPWLNFLLNNGKKEKTSRTSSLARFWQEYLFGHLFHPRPEDLPEQIEEIFKHNKTKFHTSKRTLLEIVRWKFMSFAISRWLDWG